MIDFDLMGLAVTPAMGQSVIDKAVADGHDRKYLRWRVGRYALHAIQATLFHCADLHSLRYEVEHGMAEYGTFCGVHFAFDNDIGDQALVLEVIRAADVVAIVRGAAITRYDELMARSDV